MIDNLPVSGQAKILTSAFEHLIKIIFPYDRIYPGEWFNIFATLMMLNAKEQYSYMCDLKRTLDATVISKFRLIS